VGDNAQVPRPYDGSFAPLEDDIEGASEAKRARPHHVSSPRLTFGGLRIARPILDQIGNDLGGAHAEIGGWRRLRRPRSLDRAEHELCHIDWRVHLRGPHDLAEARELSTAVRRAVADLPSGQRAAVLLVYLSGLDKPAGHAKDSRLKPLWGYPATLRSGQITASMRLAKWSSGGSAAGGRPNGLPSVLRPM
jgi:hypothetical protein